MDSARDVASGDSTNISQLVRLERDRPGAWDDAKSTRSWVCHECQGNAWPVRASKDGRAARFAARHDETCSLSRRVTNEPGHVDQQLDPVENFATTLRLLFEYGGQDGRADERHADGTEAAEGARVGRGHHDGERRAANERTQRIGAMLRHLVADPQYVEGLDGQRIEVPERGEVRPEDLIWTLDELDPQNNAIVGRHVVVWGEVYSAMPRPGDEEGTGLGYFNQGKYGDNKGAVIVDWSTLTELINRYAAHGVENFRQFDDWYVIAYGPAATFFFGQQVGVSPADASMVALLPPRGR